MDVLYDFISRVRPKIFQATAKQDILFYSILQSRVKPLLEKGFTGSPGNIYVVVF